MSVSPGGSPDFSRLTSLCHLQLHHIERFRAPVLASHASTLTYLSIEHVRLFESKHLSGLVCLLPQLQQLRHLRVETFARTRPEIDLPPDDSISLSPRETSRLLLAPQLAALELVNITIQPSQPLPDDASDAESDDDYWAWQSSEYDTDTEDTSDDEAPVDFLASTDTRPALQHLAVRFETSAIWSSRKGCGYTPVFHVRHLQRIPQVWPNLRTLDLAGALAADAAQDIPLLQLLTGLTKLALGGGSAADSGFVAQQLTGFTALKDMQLAGEDGLAPEGLVPLLQLRQLTRLDLAGVAAVGWDEEQYGLLEQEYWRTTLNRTVSMDTANSDGHCQLLLLIAPWGSVVRIGHRHGSCGMHCTSLHHAGGVDGRC
jgi:hypothetical protein